MYILPLSISLIFFHTLWHIRSTLVKVLARRVFFVRKPPRKKVAYEEGRRRAVDPRGHRNSHKFAENLTRPGKLKIKN